MSEYALAATMRLGAPVHRMVGEADEHLFWTTACGLRLHWPAFIDSEPDEYSLCSRCAKKGIE